MDTPFNSEWFVKTWIKYFRNSKPAIKFDFIVGVQFYKDKYLPIYTNIGKNLTKGFNYRIHPNKIRNNHNVYLIYDIPSYYNIPSINGQKNLKLKSISQYNGYYTTLDQYNNLDDFIVKNYSSSRRKMLRRRYNGLIKSFDISTTMYYGSIDKDTYNLLFDRLSELLKKRFQEKQTNYHILSKWDYIKELTYPMILNKEVALFVIYDDFEPIGIRLCFQHQKAIIGAIPIYDTDYSKFGLGNILTFKLIEWCINNNMEIFDSSKGDYGIKKQISDTIYSYDYHVLYNPKSVISRFLAFTLISSFQLKQYLRNRNIHTIYHNLRYRIGGKQSNGNSNQFSYQILDEEFKIENEKDTSQIDYKEQEFSILNRLVHDFLYSSGERKKDVKLYKKNDSNIYYLVGTFKQQKVLVNSF